MGLLNFLTQATQKAGGALRKIGQVAGSAIRTVGAPIAAPLKTLANAAAGVTGFSATPMGASVMGLLNKGFDYVSSGRAADAMDSVSKFGTRLATG
jgi:hypothetical protein